MKEEAVDERRGSGRESLPCNIRMRRGQSCCLIYEAVRILCGRDLRGRVVKDVQARSKVLHQRRGDPTKSAVLRGLDERWMILVIKENSDVCKNSQRRCSLEHRMSVFLPNITAWRFAKHSPLPQSFDSIREVPFEGLHRSKRDRSCSV